MDAVNVTLVPAHTEFDGLTPIEMVAATDGVITIVMPEDVAGLPVAHA